ncbi:MAG: L,D-transpeptidase family protein [bacterium]
MTAKIYIELATHKLYLKINNKQVGNYPVAVGKPATPTPRGDFKILHKIKNPGGPLGTRWMQFTTQEHGIHGTNNPSSIGKAVSLGCVRMYNYDIEKIYPRVNKGAAVIIRNNISVIQPEYDKPQTYIIHQVKKGDSLWKLSRQYNVPLEEITKINNLQGTIIYPGQKLKIPAQK